MAKIGRPTIYSKELTTEICRQIANGMSLRKICIQEGMPSIETVRGWLLEEDKSEFLAQYTRAREEQADWYADEMQELADEANLDKDAINKARLQIDTRKWIASKLKPKKYGDKLDLTTKGKELPQPLLGGISASNNSDKETSQTPQTS